MAQTPAGYYQRTNKGRFLYGRNKNYRLAPAFSAIPNVKHTLGSTDPLAGAAPLDTDNDIDVYTALPTIASINNVPTSGPLGTAGGIFAPNPGGGYAVTDEAYARVDNPTPLVAANTWIFGDSNSDTGAGSASTTPHTYAAPGTYNVNLQMIDSLQRSFPQFTGPVVATV